MSQQQIIIPSGRVGRHDGSRMLLVGVVDVVAGLIALAWPGVTVVALAVIFGLMLLLAGVVTLGVGAVMNRAGLKPTVAWVLGGVAVVAGLICLVHPGAGVFAIGLGCALWFLVTGLGYLASARTARMHRVSMGVLGVLSLIAALVLLVSPGVAIVTIAIIAGIGFLVRGLGEIVLGRRLRRSLY